jgi:predicted RNase H-like nuclease
MKFLGVDLAWGDSNETGVVALEPDGRKLSDGASARHPLRVLPPLPATAG